MKTSIDQRFSIAIVLAANLLGISYTIAEDKEISPGDKLVAEYFRQQTRRLTERTFADVKSLEDWTSRKGEYRRQLFEMLGMDPMPERTPMHPEVTGTTEADEFVVEKIHLQSMPGLYVTANLYRPKQQSGPLPAILYVCGHGRVKKDGISYGNKTNYQHHGAWFARNGYVCLTIDTVQLGEIEGIHHGTYREKMWWWNNRGYSSAGAEAWNCIRSLDYLQSRSEVDPERMGVTGRSGGGAYSWWTAALDERVKVAVPVAGITSLHNHVVDGCVQGHCDCMYMVNTYRWDYPMVAALVAPRPLLISNTDKDRIFPLDGVVDVHKKVRKIYRLYDAEDKLGLQITEGPHKDTQELRIHAFRWFNRFLKDDDSLIETTATKFFEPEELKVFDQLPEQQRVTDIHETFVPKASRDDLPDSREAFLRRQQDWMQQLTEKVFRGWPQGSEIEPLAVSEDDKMSVDGISVQVYSYTSQSPYRLKLYVADSSKAKSRQDIHVHLLSEDETRLFAGGLQLAETKLIVKRAIEANPKSTHVFCPTRGQWSTDQRVRTHIRRRFMQLGQTADGMKIWDFRRALQAINEVADLAGRPRVIHATTTGAVRALYASLFEPNISQLQLADLPKSNREGITLLNVSRFVEMPQLLLMAANRASQVHLTVKVEDEAVWKQPAEAARKTLNEGRLLNVQVYSE